MYTIKTLMLAVALAATVKSGVAQREPVPTRTALVAGSPAAPR